MISSIKDQPKNNDQVISHLNDHSNRTQDEHINIGRCEIDLENMTDLGADWSELINDHEENTFGISFYEDLIDINLKEAGTNHSNTQKIEDEVTLKSKIENILVIYKVICERPETTKLFEENNVNFGFSNDLIGTGTLILEKIEDPDVFALTWEGNLLDFLANSNKDIKEVSKYSFLIQYMIDINLKIVQDNEFFIFIKSDFQLENQTVFLQFSFNTEERANFWYENLSKYKQLTIKRAKSRENFDESQFKKFKDDIVDNNSNIRKNEMRSSNNSQAPKISVPFIRESKNSKKVKHPTSTLINCTYENLFPLIKHEDKIFIENQIKSLIFLSNNIQDSQTDNLLSIGLESNWSIIQQKCSFIKFIVNSIQISSSLENKTVSLSSSSPPKSIQSSSSSSSSSYENTQLCNLSRNRNVNTIPSQLFTCPICYENYGQDAVITLEPCGHQMCINCVYKLVDSKCPWDRLKYTIKRL
ncbi:ring domain-containing protein [Cryptosporidium canis]|uniref:Ring domain-containing protein n=1 Tax=Cryptosporidium canis TaxID=195482 RepID=A0A9D5HVU8_9CRYT|nr:ring domain-containing protein [Cryptosporidium canis]